MGLFSWFSTTVRKSEAASLIQQYFEISEKHGVFKGDPAGTANRVTELACNRVPELTEKRRGFVLAASILAIAVMEDDLPLLARDHCAMALAGMLKAALTERHLHSYEDQKMLDVAQRVYVEFRELVPSSPHEEPKLEVVKPPEVVNVQPLPISKQERDRAMDELIKRMKV